MDYQAMRVPYIKNGQQTYRTYCLVDPVGWNLGVGPERILEILQEMHCKVIKVDLLEVLRSTVGTAKYLRGATIQQAPDYFDCSSFVQWFFSWPGVLMPRYAIEQAKLGEDSYLHDLRLGDLVFTKGKIPRTDKVMPNGIGHVLIATGRGTVIHAKNRKEGVVEEPALKAISNQANFRGVRRILPSNDWWTVITPVGVEPNFSSDLRWKVAALIKR